jgi:hypothetical protein
MVWVFQNNLLVAIHKTFFQCNLCRYQHIALSCDSGYTTRGINYAEKSFMKWKGINHKQSARWQRLYRLKASAFLFDFFVTC